MDGNNLVCPKCGEKLAVFMDNSFVNMGFRIRCKCGMTYDKYKDLAKVNKRLKEY